MLFQRLQANFTFIGKVKRVEKILEKKTVVELKESATEFRIKGRSKMRKAELVKAVAREIV